MVENTSGRADDELRTAFEFGELVFERLAAGDGDHVDADRVGERPRDGGDLPRKFARRGDDQRLFLGFVRSNALQNGQQKGERFARAGTALGEYVETFEYGRDRLHLNFRRGRDAALGQYVGEFGCHSQTGKCGHNFLLLSRRGRQYHFITMNLLLL